MMKLLRFLVRPVAFGVLATAGVTARAQAADPAFIAPPPSPGVIIFALSGHVKDLHFKYNADQTRLHLRAMVSLHNNLDIALDHLTARVYVSDHAAYRQSDLVLADVKLANYLPEGKIPQHETVTLPLKRGVSSALASYLDGKYLHILVSKDGQTYGLIKFGPITPP
jgi:hypothetical protein